MDLVIPAFHPAQQVAGKPPDKARAQLSFACTAEDKELAFTQVLRQLHLLEVCSVTPRVPALLEFASSDAVDFRSFVLISLFLKSRKSHMHMCLSVCELYLKTLRMYQNYLTTLILPGLLPSSVL